MYFFIHIIRHEKENKPITTPDGYGFNQSNSDNTKRRHPSSVCIDTLNIHKMHFVQKLFKMGFKFIKMIL